MSMDMARDDGGRAQRPVLIPIFLVVLVVFLLVAFQAVQLVREHSALLALHDAQEPQLVEAQRQRAQLETIAGKTAQLAADGDAVAAEVVETMRRQGVTLKPPNAK